MTRKDKQLQRLMASVRTQVGGLLFIELQAHRAHWVERASAFNRAGMSELAGRCQGLTEYAGWYLRALRKDPVPGVAKWGLKPLVEMDKLKTILSQGKSALFIATYDDLA